MPKTSRLKPQKGASASAGTLALASYHEVLSYLGDRKSQPDGSVLPFLECVDGLQALYSSLSTVAPAVPGAPDEEWNPLSQRPHAPLPPHVSNELGAEIMALKEAVDAFTTLSHEMVHVALWEPFFVGRWRPRSRSDFRTFSLLSEGFCFFFSDIVVSGAVRVRLPDGEFALERETPSSARFHPVRAFKALRIDDRREILDIYLEGFRGERTALWQPRGTSHFVAALAAQTYDFYTGSLRYLDGLQEAISAFGGLSEFYRRFCAIPGLPSFVRKRVLSLEKGRDLKEYFAWFYECGLKNLGELEPQQATSLRWRRMLQVRAYYALQVRWFIKERLFIGHGLPANRAERLLGPIDDYLNGLRQLLLDLSDDHGRSPVAALETLDNCYERDVRRVLVAQDVWAGQRWLLAPRRAGGKISVFRENFVTDREAKVALLVTAAFIVDELTRRMEDCKSVATRAAAMASIERMASIGAAGGGSAAQTRAAAKRLSIELAEPDVRTIWSVPLACFDPLANRYRELVFSYQ